LKRSELKESQDSKAEEFFLCFFFFEGIVAFLSGLLSDLISCYLDFSGLYSPCRFLPFSLHLA